jgi:glycosyltransferase involved in cell wall biosynthesis
MKNPAIEQDECCFANTNHDKMGVSIPPDSVARSRLRVLVCAYACEPKRGSEPGVGWNIVRLLAKRHDLWVVTRADHRPAIEAELQLNPLPQVTFLYHRLPFEMGAMWYRIPLIQLHYYLWQLSLYFMVAPLHREVRFDLAHHVTYVRYWTPNAAALLGIPFVFGPVGSAEAAPPGFVREFPIRSRMTEFLRNAVRVVAEHDPMLRATVRRSTVALATTSQTAAALRRLGATEIRLCPEVGLSEKEIADLAGYGAAGGPLRLLAISRLVSWKGVHLSLYAFARADVPDAEYWIVGDGPERDRLERIARELGIADRVRFFGHISRAEVMAKLSRCHALLHPSLHDGGGWACVEAMAAGRPVLCLDWGGPGEQVTSRTGWKIVPHSRDQVVCEMASIIREMAFDPAELVRFAPECRRHVSENFAWRDRIRFLCDLYDEVLRTPANR